MYSLYLMDGYDPKTLSSKEVAVKCINDYCNKKIGSANWKVEDIRTDGKGKPYIENGPFFNLSHSENFFGILIGPKECGLDIQKTRECNIKSISNRYFSELESCYIDHNGPEAFFTIWTMREAFGKYTGLGFFGVDIKYVDEKETLIDKVIAKGREVFFNRIDMGNEVFCTCCIEENADIELYFLD